MNTIIEQQTQEEIDAQKPAIEREETPQETKPVEKEPNEPADEALQDPASKAGEQEDRAQLAALRDDLEKTRTLLDEAKRERDLQRVMMEAGAVDLEAGMLLLTAALEKDDKWKAAEESSQKRTIERAVRELVRSKPSMFRPLPGSLYATSRGRGAASATRIGRFDEDLSDASLKQAARAAAIAGDRRSLMDYLRMRRVPA